MTYIEVANSIVEDAIQSVIYVDDELTIPFEEANPDEGVLDLSGDLYKEFVNKNISIDFYRFNPAIEWRDSESFLFKNRDLVILDWQLENNDHELNTLQILECAVQTPSLHFVCIYSRVEPQTYEDLFMSITGFFSRYSNENVEKIQELLDEIIGDQLDPKFIQELKGRFKEYILFSDRRKDLKGILFSALMRQMGKTEHRHFKERIVAEFNLENSEEYLTLMSFFISKANLGEEKENYDIRLYPDDNFLYLNHTIVLLSNKAQHEPSELYSFFTSAFTQASGNFLSLMSLEINNRFRRSSALMDKHIDAIDEKAFFYHKNQITPENSFFDFLISLWKSELTDTVYHKGPILNLFNPAVLSDYINSNNLQELIEAYGAAPDSDSELAKLNYYYNKISQRDEEDILRFGDIFFEIPEDGQRPTKFLLCITAHCDCLYPSKLNNLFYFVTGDNMNLGSGIKEGDTGFNSFIKIENDYRCIKWSDRPFTVHLEDNHILKDKFIACVAGEVKELQYLCSIKENYTQRIANRAFTFPMRVGIYFADKK